MKNVFGFLQKKQKTKNQNESLLDFNWKIHTTITEKDLVVFSLFFLLINILKSTFSSFSIWMLHKAYIKMWLYLYGDREPTILF